MAKIFYKTPSNGHPSKGEKGKAQLTLSEGDPPIIVQHGRATRDGRRWGGKEEVSWTQDTWCTVL